MITVLKNACDYCHLIIHPDDSLIGTGPTSYTDTLNDFGLAYKNAGRSVAAFASIEGEDSDGDGSTNIVEINDLKYPGDATSVPGQQTAPLVTYTETELQALESHTQFLLANSHKQQFDDYVSYTGVMVKTLLTDAGLDTTDSTFQGVTVIAPDGYQKDFDASQINQAFPAGLFYAGLDTATLGTDCGFVTYPDTLPTGLTDGGEIPGEQWLMLAYQRDGMALDESYLDITTGKINGEGPFRIVVPQSDPGVPDRGSDISPTECGDAYDYDDTKDHNAGSMVRGVVAIRVNPLPDGYEDFDYQNGGWAYITNHSIILYGFGLTD